MFRRALLVTTSYLKVSLEHEARSELEDSGLTRRCGDLAEATADRRAWDSEDRMVEGVESLCAKL